MQNTTEKKMAGEREQTSMSAELAVQREEECRRRVESILNPMKETAVLLPFQRSYPRKNAQAPFGDRELGKQVLEREERSIPNHANRSIPVPQKPFQRSKLQIHERQKEPAMPHSRSFMSLSKPNVQSFSASASLGTCATNVLANSNPKQSVSDDAALHIQKIFCEVCKVECSSPLHYEQHLSGKKHRSKLIFRHVRKVAAGGIGKKQRDKQPKCELCEIWCSDESSLQMHLSGRKHRAKMLDF